MSSSGKAREITFLLVTTNRRIQQTAAIFAALGAFHFGGFGAIMAMAQFQFTVPVSKAICDSSWVDVRFELAFVFSFPNCLPMRHFEKRHFRRLTGQWIA